MLNRHAPKFHQIAAALLMLGTVSAFATDPVTQALQSAYGPYRVVLFKTGSGSQAEARQAMDMASKAWQQVVAQYAGKPGATYENDPHFKSALEDVSKVYTQAAGEIAQNQLGKAHGTLEEVREITADLRQRNQVVTFSDHMNAYHAQMERLIEHGSETLASQAGTAGMLELAGQVGVLDYLAARLEKQASDTLRGQAEFAELLKAVQNSVAALKSAVRAQDAAAVQSAIAGLKKPYSKMFVKFG
jgi:hypothetical protein